MNEYSISYEAINNYKEPVTEAIFEFMVLPCNDDSQITVDFSFDNSLGETIFQYRNVFGFQVTRIRTDKSFDKLAFSLKAKVRKRNAISTHTTTTSSIDEEIILHSSDFYLDNFLYLKKTPFTAMPEKFQEKILKKASDQPISAYLQDLNHHVGNLITLQKESKSLENTIEDILESGKGVSQDFAHLFIAICRANGVPARFVSGYLNEGLDYSSYATMHAWAEALVPGYGWVGYDPANIKKVDVNYIKVAHGVDYRDCSPIKGVIKTKNSSAHDTFHRVEVIEQQSKTLSQ
ncbi:MAG: transglutaminase family protein [Cytophagales bacterium]|nr:transglutaminase family protein [Cytophaga sp.]